MQQPDDSLSHEAKTQDCMDHQIDEAPLDPVCIPLRDTLLGPEEMYNMDVVATALYCQVCQDTLNGKRAWDDHKIRKKHRKNMEKARLGNTSHALSIATPAAGSSDQPYESMPVADAAPDDKSRGCGCCTG